LLQYKDDPSLVINSDWLKAAAAAAAAAAEEEESSANTSTESSVVQQGGAVIYSHWEGQVSKLIPLPLIHLNLCLQFYIKYNCNL
jgi:hypothetical protein